MLFFLDLAEVVGLDHGLLEIGVGGEVVFGEVEAVEFVGVAGVESGGALEDDPGGGGEGGGEGGNGEEADQVAAEVEEAVGEGIAAVEERGEGLSGLTSRLSRGLP